MADRISTFTIAIDGDATDITSLVNGLKTTFKSAIADIQSTTSKIQLFQNAQADADKAAAALKTAVGAVDAYANAIKAAQAAGKDVGADLTSGLQAATAAAAAAGRELDKQNSTVIKLGAQLTKAGVDTKNLAQAQTALATALKQASAAADLNAAKQALGFKAFGDIQPQLTKIASAYQLVRSQGGLTLSEQIGLWGQYQKQVSAVRAQVPGIGAALEALGGPAAGLAASLVTPFTAAAAAITAIVAGLVAATEEYNKFNDELVRGQAVTNVSQQQLAKLAEGARDISTEFGVDAQTSVRTLFELIRSGIPPDNALEVLRESAQAAQGGFASLTDTAKLGLTVINGYGQTASALPKVFDQITEAAKQGGATIGELASSIGDLLPVASAAGVPFEQLLAAIVAMRKAGLDTGTAVQTLQKLLVGLADPQVVSKLADLGIKVTDLAGTLQQISDKNLNLSQVRELGLDTRSIRGVLALTNGYQNMAGALHDLQANSEGAAAAQASIADKSHEDAVNKQAAAWSNLKTSIGSVVAPSNSFLSALSSIENSIATGIAKFEAFRGSGSSLDTLMKSLALDFDLVSQALGRTATTAPQAQAALTAAISSAGTAAQAVAAQVQNLGAAIDQQLKTVSKAITDTRANLGNIAGDLATQVSAAQAQLTEALKNIDTLQKQQLADLDAQNLSQQQKAQESIAIEQKAGADRLAALKAASTQIIAAFNTEAQARLAAASGNAQDLAKVEQKLLVDRKAILGQFIQAYQDQIATLTKAEADYIEKIKGIDQQRVDFNRSINNQIDELRAQSLGGYAVYGQKVKEIDDLIAAARDANLKGEFKQAQDYATQAQNLVGSISQAVTENGSTIIDSYTAQQTAISKLGDIQGVYNKALDGTKAAAVDGKQATEDQLTDAQKALAALKTQYDDLNTQLSRGIAVQITIDARSIKDTLRDLDTELERERTLGHLKFDTEEIKAQVSILEDDIKAGFTAAAQAGADSIKEKLQEIADNAPELGLDVSKATAAVDDLKTKIDDVTAARDVQITPKVDDKQALADLDNLSKDRSMTLTVNVKAVGDTGALGLAGGGVDVTSGAGGLGFARGGVVPRLRAHIRRFARGGGVFTGRKVPGSGNGDTYPATLQGGSYVMRKAASRYYGDSLLGKIARFAIGGQVGFSFPPRYNGLIQQALGQGLSFDIGGGAPGNEDVADLNAKLQQIIDAATNLTRSQTLPDIGTWASALKERILALPAGRIAPIRQAVDDNFQLMLDTIAFARQFHVPAVVGPDLFAFLFASGGGAPGGDTVPALLTPGEWVVNRKAVQSYGTPFMNALNSMAIPRSMLANMVEAPKVRRFAAGGQVPGPTLSSTVGAVRESTVTNININGAGMADLLSEANVRRYIAPALERIQRRSK